MGNKGGTFERDISKFLTKWLTGKITPYYFWRSEASGGLATIHAANVHLTGDIKSLHPDSQFFTDVFSIECKNGYKKTSFWQHWSQFKFGMEEFWKQTCDDAYKANKHPMLIYRKKGRRQIIGIDKYIQKKLKKRLVNLNSIVLTWKKSEKLENLYVYDLIDFFDNITPNDIKRILNSNS